MAKKAPVRTAYERLVATARSKDYKGDSVREELRKVMRAAFSALSRARKVPLDCDTGKNYFSFVTSKGRRTRPINESLFDASLDAQTVDKVLERDVDGLSTDALNRALYTMAMSYCAAADFVSASGGDKKTPATFFEIFCAHLVSAMLDVNPAKQIEVQSIDIHNSLPTDFIFDMGPRQNKIHMPVKTSTRERVIQVWAHQRVLDGVFGVGRFKGMLVCLSETNAKPNDGVTEVCLPHQWTIYQMFIAQLHRVYYFDLPQKYADLGTEYPFIQVKPFAALFSEFKNLATASPFS